MGDTEGWQRELTELGLTGYEARVYLALVNRSRYTAAQVARDMPDLARILGEMS